MPTGVVLLYIYVTVSPATDHLCGAQGDNGAGSDTAIGAVEALLDTAGELQRSVLLLQVGVINLSHTLIVRKTPSWPRSWPNSSLFSLYSRRDGWANLLLLGQHNTFVACFDRVFSELGSFALLPVTD